MPKLSRRAVGASAAAVTSFSIGRARAAEFIYQYANSLPLTHQMNKRTTVFGQSAITWRPCCSD